MSEYTYSEIMKMQNDAIKRVEEMQKRAQAVVGNEQPKKDINRDSEQPKRVPMPDSYLDGLKNFAANSSYTPKSNTAVKRENAPHINNGNGINSLLNNINFDSDTALVLSLVMLLSEEPDNEALVLALLYILT